jgi:hypothetical protein
MIRTLSGMLLGGLILGAFASAYAGPFTWREKRQQAPICQGVRSEEVTSREFRHLEWEQASIEAHRRMAWSDGTLSPWEARRLIREQNHASRDIWRTKHNVYPAW